MKQLRVYLSSTFEDLKDFRSAVFAKLEQAGLDVARMEGYTATDERPLDLCLRDVAESDIYVGLFAWRYGYEPPPGHGNPLGRSITELEYRQAEEAGLRKLLFFAHPETRPGWPERFDDARTGQGDGGGKLTRLRAELGTEKVASFFRSPEELATLVLAAIMRSGKSGRIYNIPPRPPGFVARPALTGAIVGALTGPGDGVPGRSTLIQGSGGFGKTTLAIDACHQTAVLSAFPDGLLWTVLGEKPDLTRVLADLYASVTGSPPAVAGAGEIGKALGKALAGRRCLVVVDDAWRADDLTPFLNLVGPVLLVTTRIRALIEQTGQTGWPEVPVDEMDAQEAAGVLGRGLRAGEDTAPSLQQLADQLGCWPLLLDLANARLLEEVKSRPEKLPECIARVTMLFGRKGVLGFDRRDSSSRNAAVARSVDVGLERADELESGLAGKAAELSVFDEDLAIPVYVLADLWSMDAFLVEEDVLKHLDNLSIVRWDRETESVRLHDMIRRVLGERLAEPAGVHRRLLDRFSAPGHSPSEYVWLWFGWHCVQAGEPLRLLDRLVDVGFLQAKLEATDINALSRDFALLDLDAYPQVALLHMALRMSANVLGADKTQLVGQLLGRIPEGNTWLRAQVERQAGAMREPWLRPLRPTLMSPAGALLRTFEGHTGEVTCVAIMADGRRAVSGSRDRTLRIWDLQSGASLRRLDGHTGGVLAVALLPDGRHALSAGSDHTLKLWDLEHGTVLHALEGHTGSVSCVAVTPDGTRAVSTGFDGTVRIWDLARGVTRHVLDAPAGNPPSLVIAHDGQRVVLDAGRMVQVVDVERGELLASFTDDAGLALMPDGRHVLLSDGRLVPIDGLDSGDVWRTLDQWPLQGRDSFGGRPFAMSRHGTRLISCGRYDHSLTVWDLERGTELRQLRGHSSHVLGVVVTSDGQRALSCSRDGTLKLWDLGRDELEVANEGHVGAQALAMTRDGQRAVSASLDWTLKVWDVGSGQPLRTLQGHEGSVNDVALSPDGRLVVSASSDGTLKVWDLGSGALLRTLSGHTAPVIAVVITPDGECAVSASDDHTLNVWHLAHGELLRTLSGHADDVDGVVLTPDARRVISSGKPCTLKVWELASGDLLQSDDTELPYWSDFRRAILAAAPDGRFLVIGREDTLWLWDLDGRALAGSFRCHADQVTAFSFAPGSEWLAVSASRDRTVTLCNVYEQRVVARFATDFAVAAAAIDSAATTIAACDLGGYMHFLRIENAP